MLVSATAPWGACYYVMLPCCESFDEHHDMAKHRLRAGRRALCG